MYAVIKSGGKQYRVQPGDVLVVEKLDGEPGANVSFGDVLMLGDGDAVTLGAPLVAGASVAATLIETRKGEKVKIFKKIRRQGYRRTRGHRQHETVLRVTAINGEGGKEAAKWDGTVDLTTKAELNARSRNLAFQAPVAAEAAPAKKAAAPKAKAASTKEAAKAAQVNAPVETEAKAAPKKAAAPKAEGEAKKPAAKKAAAKKDTGAAE
ncbi:50S ribosomal protein L21 [Phenylobacterium sp. J367]|uniref:50S ribosomal protein L21 n=1 Tax=Phenylobacterium sp. J367 TaxID=2898435 RepID=UPI0021513565|nr:50S ribosomal protein L21 [Phenylobacterium sp. J367]MCR5878412.1 50S ribosomal protein L21 [Phenylobacterium sp. J367]